jgi:hypothetical protein
VIVPPMRPKPKKLFRSESPPVAGPSKPRARKRRTSPPVALSTRSKRPRLASDLGELASQGRSLMRKVQQAVLDLGEWEDEVNKVLKEESK